MNFHSFDRVRRCLYCRRITKVDPEGDVELGSRVVEELVAKAASWKRQQVGDGGCQEYSTGPVGEEIHGEGNGDLLQGDVHVAAFRRRPAIIAEEVFEEGCSWEDDTGRKQWVNQCWLEQRDARLFLDSTPEGKVFLQKEVSFLLYKMMHRYYDTKLLQANNDLGTLLEVDSRLSGRKPIPKPETAFQLIAQSYIRYCCLLNKMNECYVGVVQPDKSQIIRRLMDAIVGRILELKMDFVQLELTDFQYMDKDIIANKVTRESIEIEVPVYYRQEREDELREFDFIIDAIEQQVVDRLEEVEMEVTEGETEGTPEEDEEAIGEEGEEDEEAEDLEEAFEEEKEEEQPGKEDDSSKKLKRPAAFKKIILSPSRIEFIRMVGVIQKHERARVVRLQLQVESERRRVQHDIAWLIHKAIPADIKLKCADIIGRYWKRYKERRHSKYRQFLREMLIGAISPSYKDMSWKADLAKLLMERRRLQLEATASIADTTAVIAIRLESERAMEMTEDIIDELRFLGFLRCVSATVCHVVHCPQPRHSLPSYPSLALNLAFDHQLYFIRTWYDVTLAAELPQFPIWPDPEPIPPPNKILGLPKGCPEEWSSKMFTEVVNQIPQRWYGTGKTLPMLGGSALITAGHWVPPDLYLLAVEATNIAKKKNKGQTKKKLTKEEQKQLALQEKEKLDAQKEAARIKLEELRKKGFMPMESKYLEVMKAGKREYDEDWRQVDDVEWNPNQGPIEERITYEEAFKLQLKLRAAVDEIMLLELDRLQAALERDNKRLRRKMKKPKKKKPKKGGGKKVKKPPPVVDKMPIFKELATKGIISKYERRTIKEDVPGEYGLSNEDKRTFYFLDPEPGLGDLRQVIKEYCVLPLGGSASLRASLPPQAIVKSVLFAGPPERTKPAVEAVCSEAGALLFRLDPLTICRAYKPKKLIKVLTKAMKLFEPVVLWVDGVEKSYYKKVPKPEKKMKAKKLAKALPKLVKAITPANRILLLGTAYEPWRAKKSMVSRFQKVIGWPKQDAASMAKFWHERLMRYHAVDRHFPCTALATVTALYPTYILEDVIKKVMTADRIISLKYRPLQAAEFVEALPDDLELPETMMRSDQPSHWEWAADSTPLYIQRKQKLADEAELRAKMDKLAAKKKKKAQGGKKMTPEEEIDAIVAEFGEFEEWRPTPSQEKLEAQTLGTIARQIQKWGGLCRFIPSSSDQVETDRRSETEEMDKPKIKKKMRDDKKQTPEEKIDTVVEEVVERRPTGSEKGLEAQKFEDKARQSQESEGLTPSPPVQVDTGETEVVDSAEKKEQGGEELTPEAGVDTVVEKRPTLSEEGREAQEVQDIARRSRESVNTGV